MKPYWPSQYASLDFILPDASVAKEPIFPPDHARLLVVHRETQKITHDYFFNVGKYLNAHDSIFFNATRVEERRAKIVRKKSGKIFDCIFLKEVQADFLTHSPNTHRVWQVLLRNTRRIKEGEIFFAQRDATCSFTFHRENNLLYLVANKELTANVFTQIGQMPIPPYMERDAEEKDIATYQNFFLEKILEKEKIKGSAASPTASLHFTPELFKSLQNANIQFFPVCLDIGYGTFAPLTQENFLEKKLHAEHFFIPKSTVESFNSARRRIVLGTTALRAIISWQRYGVLEGETSLFITPEEKIEKIDGLITNFHLPQSSLLLLTAAFCGSTLLKHAYEEAIKNGYRFYSYGDAMLIL